MGKSKKKKTPAAPSTKAKPFNRNQQWGPTMDVVRIVEHFTIAILGEEKTLAKEYVGKLARRISDAVGGELEPGFSEWNRALSKVEDGPQWKLADMLADAARKREEEERRRVRLEREAKEEAARRASEAKKTATAAKKKKKKKSAAPKKAAFSSTAAKEAARKRMAQYWADRKKAAAAGAEPKKSKTKKTAAPATPDPRANGSLAEGAAP